MCNNGNLKREPEHMHSVYNKKKKKNLSTTSTREILDGINVTCSNCINNELKTFSRPQKHTEQNSNELIHLN